MKRTNFYKEKKRRGKEAEEKFKISAKLCGFKVKKSSKEDDIKKHIDFYLEKQGKKFSVDVKSAKRIRASDKDVSFKYTYIEIRNVKGEKGWVLGEADYIAFELKNHFLLIKREEIIRYIKKLIKENKLKKERKREENHLYSRGKDLMILVDINKVRKFAKGNIVFPKVEKCEKEMGNEELEI